MEYTKNQRLSRATATLFYSFYQEYQEATQDELQLRGVRLPCNQHCVCPGPDGGPGTCKNGVVDCVAVSCASEKLNLEVPHWPRLDDSEVRYGSEFNKRIVIPDEATRDAVYELAHTTANKGVSLEELEDLTEKLRQHRCERLATLLPLILQCHEVATVRTFW